MSRQRLHLNKGSLAPPPPPIVGPSIGVNFTPSPWWTYSTPYVDTAAAGIDNSVTGSMVGGTTGNPVPDANRDANGYPKSLPSGEANINFVTQLPISNAQRSLTWASKAGGANLGCSSLTISNATGVTVTLATKTATYTPTNILGIGVSDPPSIRYVPVSTTDYPINFQDRPVSDPGGLLSAEFLSGVTGACSSSFVTRFMDWTTVNRNSSPIHDPTDTNYQFPGLHNPSAGSEPGTQLNEPIYTSANRNTNVSDPTWHDGMPVERLVSTCTALGSHAWYNLPWNADSTFMSAVATLWAAFSVATGKKVYVEQSNEVWNFSFTVAHQCQNEATLLGIAREERYAQKSVANFAYFETAFASAGVSDKLVRVLAWQNYASPTIWDTMLDFTGIYSHVDMLAVAPYYGDNTEMGIAATYTGSTSALTAAIKADMDASLVHTAGHLTKAQARSKTLGFYEGGFTTNLSDNAYKTTYVRSSDAYDLEIRFLQQIELLFPAGTVLCSYAFTYPLSANAFAWGLLETVSQSRSKTTVPKWQAHNDFKNNIRQPSDLTGTLSAVAGNPVNTVLGSLSGRVSGSTMTVTTGSTAVGFVDATANVLQPKIIDAATFASGGTVNIVVRETYANFPAPGYHDTALSISVLSGTIWNAATSDAAFTISGAGLTAGRASGGGNRLARANVTRTSGYFEIVPTLNTTGEIGLTDSAQVTTDWIGGGTNSIGYLQSGQVYDNGGNLVATYASWTTNDVISVCLKGGKVYFAKNGTWQGSSNPSTGTGGITVSGFLTNAIPGVSTAGTSSFTARFTTGFSYSVPTGVTAWS